MKTGIFGGSFDPIHFGHISLAVQILEIHRLDKILFIPAFCSPFKTAAPPVASGEHRIKMLQLALQDLPQFEVSRLEIDRKGPSYTIDTLRALDSEWGQIHLILSEEAFAHFGKWKDSEELLRLAPPLVGIRGKNPPRGLPPKSFTMTKIFEISSTEIRDRLKKRLYCGHLVPAKVLDYIHAHDLYS